MARKKTHCLLATDDIDGTSVLSETGEKLGEMERLVLDAVNGRIAYAVVAFGGVMGLGKSSYSIPWDSMRFSVDDRVFVTAITRQQIETAPDRPEDWYRDRDWEEKTFAHFGATPYWR